MPDAWSTCRSRFAPKRCSRRCKTHLGLQFVRDTLDEPPAHAAIPHAPRHAALAARLREAAEIGDITDLQALADTLAAGDEVDAALGRRIGALAANFDFDGVHALAASLEAAPGSSDAR